MDYRGIEDDDGIVGWMKSLRLDGGGDDGDGRDGGSSFSSILPQLVGWMETLRLDAGGDGDVRDGVKGVGVRGSGDGVSSSSSSTLPQLLQSVTGLLRGMVLEEEEDHEHDMASEWEDIDHDMVSEDDEDIDRDMISEEDDIDHVEE